MGLKESQRHSSGLFQRIPEAMPGSGNDNQLGGFVDAIGALCVREGNNRILIAVDDENIALGEGCSLSEILVPDAPERYYLPEKQVAKLLYRAAPPPPEVDTDSE